jgi:hypothetical protein
MIAAVMAVHALLGSHDEIPHTHEEEIELSHMGETFEREERR